MDKLDNYFLSVTDIFLDEALDCEQQIAFLCFKKYQTGGPLEMAGTADGAWGEVWEERAREESGLISNKTVTR